MTFAFAFADFDQSGSGTVNLQIPGTFAGAAPASFIGAGRFLKNIAIWSPNAVDNDRLTNAQLADNDGIVPAPARALFPNYPVIVDFLDQISGQDKELQIPTGGITVEAFDSLGNPAPQFLPGQLYLNLTFATGGGILRTFRGTIRWGYYQ